MYRSVALALALFVGKIFDERLVISRWKNRPMTPAKLEERVERLERIVDELQARRSSEPERDDWIATIGMFRDDPIAKEIIDEALRQREEERRQVRP